MKIDNKNAKFSIKKTPFNLTCALFLLLSGCISTPDLIRQNKIPASKFSLDNFNKSYNNRDTSSKGLNAWMCIYDCLTFKNDTIAFSSYATVKLSFDNKNKLYVTISDDGKEIKTIVLKAKLHGDYLSLKRNLFLIPIPFIWTRYHEARAVLYNDTNGNLMLNYARSQFVWTLMAGSVDQKFNQTHLRNTK